MIFTADECNAVRKLLLNAYRSMPYDEYLKTDHWEEMRLQMGERSKFRCQLCTGRERLEVHHNSYKNVGQEQPEDLILLCHECHSKFHGKNIPAANGATEASRLKALKAELLRQDAEAAAKLAKEAQP